MVTVVQRVSRAEVRMEVDLVNDGPVTFIVEVRGGALVKPERA